MMQRFIWMNVYSACVLLLVIVAIATVTLLKPTQGATKSAAPEAPTATAVALKSVAQSPVPLISSSRQATVSIDDFKFTPRELSVSVGDTVTWINRDDVPHTATSKDDPGTFDSKALDTDDKYSFTFTKPGTYSYYCKVHTHMTASIIVK
jgi:plastocyanin